MGVLKVSGLLAALALSVTGTGVVPAATALSGQAVEGEGIDSLRAAVEALEAQDYARAHAVAQALSSEGDLDAQYLLGYLTANGLGTAIDMPRAIELYAAAATAGQVNAQFALGELAYRGEAAKRDLDRAAQWFNLAASRGHMRAKHRLATMYALGESVPQDLDRAAYLFEEAAAGGVPDAQYRLGVMYLEGEGRPKDYARAAAWFEKAAASGDPVSMYNLGLLHESGRLGRQDLSEAGRWMAQAADAGVPQAMVSVGLLRVNGRGGFERDPAVAMRWFRQAAEAGDADGMYLLAVGLSDGLGGTRDYDAARIWADRALAASDGSDPEATAERRALADQLRDLEARQARLAAARRKAQEDAARVAAEGPGEPLTIFGLTRDPGARDDTSASVSVADDGTGEDRASGAPVDVRRTDGAAEEVATADAEETRDTRGRGLRR